MLLFNRRALAAWLVCSVLVPLGVTVPRARAQSETDRSTPIESERLADASTGASGVSTAPPPTESTPLVDDERPYAMERGLERGRRRARRRLDAGRLLGNAIVGDVIGSVAGGLLALGISGGIGCQNGESNWMGGFYCASGHLFALSFGALYGATIGGPLGVLRAGSGWDAGGDEGLPLVAGGTGLVLGTLIGGITAAVQGSPTIAVAVGGGVGVIASTLGAVFLYDGSRPSREVDRPVNRVSCLPVVAPTDGGVSFALAGTF